MTVSAADMLTARIVNPLGEPRWDDQLPSHATFFHTRAWGRVLHETYGYTPSYLVAENGDGSQSVLPLMEPRSWVTGFRGVTLPFTDECQALYTDPEGFRFLFAQALALGKRRGWKYYELRGAPADAGEFPSSLSFYGHHLELHSDPSALFSEVDSAVRRAVRKAENGGVAVQFSRDLAGIRTFYELLCRTRRRHGLPPQSFEFFANIHRHVLQPGHGDVIIARLGEQPVAGAVFFHFGRTVLYKFAASDEAFQHVRGNNSVLWSAIQHYAGQGFTRLDFGRTSLANEGLRRFKLSWRSQERRIDYLRYAFALTQFTTSSDQSVAGWHNAVFRAIPSGLSRLIGAALYKHLG